jgi:hypothetical protein
VGWYAILTLLDDARFLSGWNGTSARRLESHLPVLAAHCLPAHPCNATEDINRNIGRLLISPLDFDLNLFWGPIVETVFRKFK